MRIAIFLHQFDLIHEQSLEEIHAKFNGPIYVKAVDATQQMAAFDRSELAVGRGTWDYPTENIIPWVVPTGVSPMTEARLACNEYEQVIVDLEPYDHFWNGSLVDQVLYCQGFTSDMALSLDYRRLPGFPSHSFINKASRFLPQCYWTSFQRPWQDVLEECKAKLEVYGKPIEYVIPGDAEPDDFSAALSWIDNKGSDASVWVWQHIRDENWQLINSDNQTYDDLISKLGYLQGDVAKAIREPLEAAIKSLGKKSARAGGTPNYRRIKQALDAVSTLENT